MASKKKPQGSKTTTISGNNATSIVGEIGKQRNKYEKGSNRLSVGEDRLDSSSTSLPSWLTAALDVLSSANRTSDRGEAEKLANTLKVVQSEIDPKKRKLLDQVPNNEQEKKNEQEEKLLQREKKITIDGVKYIIVEGDIPLTEEQYNNYEEVKEQLESLKKNYNPALISSVSLLGMVDDGKRLIRWDPQIARNLTYWIDKKSFSDSESITAGQIKIFMVYATSSWASVCGVSFQEVEGQKEALFRVAFTKDNNEPGLMASAFFPDWPAERRTLWIYPDFSRTGYDMPGILRHELGHILGFRHEHIRIKGLQFDEPTDNLYGITPYDSKSVMHYFLPPYGGSKNGEITSLDAAGATFYYGPPLHKFTEYQ